MGEGNDRKLLTICLVHFVIIPNSILLMRMRIRIVIAFGMNNWDKNLQRPYFTIGYVYKRLLDLAATILSLVLKGLNLMTELYNDVCLCCIFINFDHILRENVSS